MIWNWIKNIFKPEKQDPHLVLYEEVKEIKEPEKFVVNSSETKIFYVSQLKLVRKNIDDLGWDYYLDKMKKKFSSTLGPMGSLEY